MTDASVTDEGRAGEVMEGKAGQDIKVALVVIAFVLGGFFVARDYPLTAAAWPYGILAIMLSLAAILMGLGAWRSRRQSAEPTSVPGEPATFGRWEKLRSEWNWLLVMVTLLAYVIAMDVAGFFIATWVLMFLFMVAYRQVSPAKIIIVPVSLTIGIYLVIGVLMRVPLPDLAPVENVRNYLFF